MPVDLKKKLELEAKNQGVSINQLSNYLLAVQLTQLETLYALESRLEKKSIPELKERVRHILEKVPGRQVPAWDRL
jgi:hypothetical protein